MHRGAAEAAEEGVSLDEFIESKQEWAMSKEKQVNERILRLLKHAYKTRSWLQYHMVMLIIWTYLVTFVADVNETRRGGGH